MFYSDRLRRIESEILGLQQIRSEQVKLPGEHSSFLRGRRRRKEDVTSRETVAPFVVCAGKYVKNSRARPSGHLWTANIIFWLPQEWNLEIQSAYKTGVGGRLLIPKGIWHAGEDKNWGEDGLSPRSSLTSSPRVSPLNRRSNFCRCMLMTFHVYISFSWNLALRNHFVDWIRQGPARICRVIFGLDKFRCNRTVQFQLDFLVTSRRHSSTRILFACIQVKILFNRMLNFSAPCFARSWNRRSGMTISLGVLRLFYFRSISPINILRKMLEEREREEGRERREGCNPRSIAFLFKRGK